MMYICIYICFIQFLHPWFAVWGICVHVWCIFLLINLFTGGPGGEAKAPGGELGKTWRGGCT